MPTYVTLIKWTERGSRDRSRPGRAARLGGRLTALSWTQGASDVVAAAESPDERAAMAWPLTLGGRGDVPTETLRASGAPDRRRILAPSPRPGEQAGRRRPGPRGSPAGGTGAGPRPRRASRADGARPADDRGTEGGASAGTHSATCEAVRNRRLGQRGKGRPR
jgi:uncharacterized protein with GYD domain